jgi:hypothetical protein
MKGISVLELSRLPASVRIGELERPQEVGSLLEVGANSVDLMDKIFHGEDVIFTEGGLDNSVVGKRDALLVNLSVATLVDKFSNGLQVWFADNNAIKPQHLRPQVIYNTHPYVIYGSTSRSICSVALVTLTKTPLLI